MRDFRDMLCSIRAFNEKRGTSAFGLEGEGAEVGYVQDMLAPSVDSLLHEWRSRADRAHLVRYEDLITAPQDTLAGVLDHAGLDASGGRVEEMLSDASDQIPGMADHATATGGPAASIGRWRGELGPSCALRATRRSPRPSRSSGTRHDAQRDHRRRSPSRGGRSGCGASTSTRPRPAPRTTPTGSTCAAGCWGATRVTSVELKDGERLLWRVPTTIARPELAAEYPQATDTGAAGFFDGGERPEPRPGLRDPAARAARGQDARRHGDPARAARAAAHRLRARARPADGDDARPHRLHDPDEGAGHTSRRRRVPAVRARAARGVATGWA